MASSRIALFLLFNILFFTMVASNYAPCPPPPSPKPHPGGCHGCSSHPPLAKCDTLKLRVCATLLNPLVHLRIGTHPQHKCCSLIEGLVDLDAAVCLCTAIKANVLGINLNVPVSLSLLLNACGKKIPKGFKCA